MSINAIQQPYAQGLGTQVIAATVGTSSTLVLAQSQAFGQPTPVNPPRFNVVELQNVGTTTIGFSFGTTAPSIGAAGTFTLAPLSSWNSPSNFVMLDSISAISGGAGGQLSGWWA